MTFTVASLCQVLQSIAPIERAAEWDNVGLLVEPLADAPVSGVLLAIDLTEAVLAEAVALGVNAIVAYHPPIFGGLRRLTRSRAGERVVVDALRAGIAVYSPHTALDAAPSGLNDWLAEAAGPGVHTGFAPGASPGEGSGRRVQLHTPVPLATVVARIKARLQLPLVRVAASSAHAQGGLIGSVAVCAGAGASVLEAVRPTDLLLTGEMRHHDVLAWTSRGTSVVLCDHSNTERGYLPLLKITLDAQVPVPVHVSASDREPLTLL